MWIFILFSHNKGRNRMETKLKGNIWNINIENWIYWFMVYGV